MKIAAAGDRALLVTLPDATAARLRAIADELRGFECVVGYDSLLVISVHGGTTDRKLVAQAVAHAREAPSNEAKTHLLSVSFADEYAFDLAGLPVSRDELLAHIRDVRLDVRFLGFKPGWAYLDGWPEAWRLPRRATSRNHVPRGSFAIAGAFAGFYAVDSPGGWNILGRTDAMLWDGEKPLLAAGDVVRIEPTLDRIEVPPLPAPPPLRNDFVDIVKPGQMTTLTTKPFDEPAARAVRRSVGCVAPHDDAVFECVLVGPRVKFRVDAHAAWCGGDGIVHVFDKRAGEELDIGRFHGGLRGYLAIGNERGDVANVARDDRHVVRVIRGPHDSPFVDSDWEVTPQLDRVGIRLRPLGERITGLPADLPSCGVLFGTLQWHPDGSLVAMGPDHPVTGGYLQPATVVSSDLWKLAQLAPGERVRLTAE